LPSAAAAKRPAVKNRFAAKVDALEARDQGVAGESIRRNKSKDCRSTTLRSKPASSSSHGFDGFAVTVGTAVAAKSCLKCRHSARVDENWEDL
jgi:hypothetical protein